MKATKAKEVLRRYAARERDFRGLNFQGESFRGANLSGANFSDANFSNTKLHSTKFTNAILINANFTDAECGLQKRNIAFLLYGIVVLIIVLEIGLFASIYGITSILNDEI